MTQFDAVTAVYAFYKSSRAMASSTDVRDWIREQTGDDLGIADVSRTLLRAQRNGRLFRHPSRTDDGYFLYEYGIRRKGYRWLVYLARKGDDASNQDASSLESHLGDADVAPLDADDVDESDSRNDGAWTVEHGGDGIVFCDECEAAISEGDRFCRMCGVRFEAVDR
jgi:hypothetical protein